MALRPRATSRRIRRPPGIHRRAEATSTAALLQLMWLASPALPVGGFSYSEGLEAAVEAGHVGTEAQARTWLVDQLHLVLARAELALVARAFQAWQRHDVDTLTALNAWMTTTRESSEMRQQSEQMGRSMVEWLKNRGGVPDARVTFLGALKPAPTWPLAFALAATQSGAARSAALSTLAFGWAENMVQAALKAVPLGQSAGQRVLAALVEEIPVAVASSLSLGEGEVQAFAPMLSILSAHHEHQYSRLFRS